jgi:hypothetical protein
MPRACAQNRRQAFEKALISAIISGFGSPHELRPLAFVILHASSYMTIRLQDEFRYDAIRKLYAARAKAAFSITSA